MTIKRDYKATIYKDIKNLSDFDDEKYNEITMCIWNDQTVINTDNPIYIDIIDDFKDMKCTIIFENLNEAKNFRDSLSFLINQIKEF